MAARPWHERAEPFEKRQRIEDDVSGAIAIALLEPVADAAPVESLDVAVAAGVQLFEAWRQRG